MWSARQDIPERWQGARPARPKRQAPKLRRIKDGFCALQDLACAPLDGPVRYLGKCKVPLGRGGLWHNRLSSARTPRFRRDISRSTPTGVLGSRSDLICILFFMTHRPMLRGGNANALPSSKIRSCIARHATLKGDREHGACARKCAGLAIAACETTVTRKPLLM